MLGRSGLCPAPGPSPPLLAVLRPLKPQCVSCTRIPCLAPSPHVPRSGAGGRGDDPVVLRHRLDKAERAVEKERRAAQDLERQLRENAAAAAEGRAAQEAAVQLRHRQGGARAVVAKGSLLSAACGAARGREWAGMWAGRHAGRQPEARVRAWQCPRLCWYGSRGCCPQHASPLLLSLAQLVHHCSEFVGFAPSGTAPSTAGVMTWSASLPRRRPQRPRARRQQRQPPLCPPSLPWSSSSSMSRCCWLPGRPRSGPQRRMQLRWMRRHTQRWVGERVPGWLQCFFACTVAWHAAGAASRGWTGFLHGPTCALLVVSLLSPARPQAQAPILPGASMPTPCPALPCPLASFTHLLALPLTRPVMPCNYPACLLASLTHPPAPYCGPAAPWTCRPARG